MKKLLALILAICMLVTFTACGSQENNNTEQSSPKYNGLNISMIGKFHYTGRIGSMKTYWFTDNDDPSALYSFTSKTLGFDPELNKDYFLTVTPDGEFFVSCHEVEYDEDGEMKLKRIENKEKVGDK